MSSVAGWMGASDVRRHGMAIVIGFDIHHEQVTFDALDDGARFGVDGSRRRTGSLCAGFWRRCRLGRSMSRWRRRQAGGSSSRSCSPRAP
jgi:hypothetical protein